MFDWFLGRPHFSIVFGNDVIMTSFLVTCFSNLHIFVEFTKGYHPAKFQCCRFSGVKFYKGITKHNDDVIMTSFHILGF